MNERLLQQVKNWEHSDLNAENPNAIGVKELSRGLRQYRGQSDSSGQSDQPRRSKPVRKRRKSI